MINPNPGPSLTTIPTDVLDIIFLLLWNTAKFRRRHGRPRAWNAEDFTGAELIPISTTCRYLRERSKPWIFRKVYNWSRTEGDIWPDTLWPSFAEVHLRDRSIWPSKNIILSTAIFKALPVMSSLKKVTSQMDTPVSPELLLTATIAPRDVDRQIESSNVPVVTLLQTVSGRLTSLSISGDLMSLDFLSIKWPLSRNFVVTENTPVQYIPVPETISQMPALRKLSILHSADLSRNPEDLHPPFTLGTLDGRPLILTTSSPNLHSVTLSNLLPTDPIFAQLPASLEALHIVAVRDVYIPERSAPEMFQETPLTSVGVLTVISLISQLTELTELTLTLDHFPTPALIGVIAGESPRLRFLELGCSGYPCDVALIEPLEQLTYLTYLLISLDFFDRLPPIFQQNDQERAAGWFLGQLPALQIVAFSFEEWLHWYPDMVLERISWRTYHRGNLQRLVPTLAREESLEPVIIIPDNA
ncbi:hypothetical protein B0H11DRAFT_2412841 [Mycena galericulata]|nr:hypothetical protein B0H11DRAFT_2412841 [Mycena galericulata]